MAEKLLPDNATIQQVAAKFGISKDKLAQLTPAASKLTKGEMIAVLGANHVVPAVQLVAEGKRPTAQAMTVNARINNVDLSVKDVQSVQRVFAGDAFPAADRTAVLNGLNSLNKASLAATSDGWTVYVCCCPCCCATAVTEPVRRSVA